MAEYKIARVSDKEPKPVYSEKWKSTTFYIRVMLEGVPRPVEIGKKKPDALKVGDAVHGDIIPKPEFEADGFKADPTAFGGGGGGYSGGGSSKPAYSRDDDAIRAQWAIGQAVVWTNANPSQVYDDIEGKAKEFYAMVDRVKGSDKIDATPDPMDKVHAQNPLSTVTDEFGDGAEYVNNEELPPGF